MEKTVVELFAGVGGFRVGLNNVSRIGLDGKAIESKDFNIIWANQWEPSTKSQDAFNCYISRFGNNCVSNEDISKVDKNKIPHHSLLVGGFPCQDYSVARTIANEKGIEGKKGVLWWQIRDILSIHNTPFVLLENVDRLIKSPTNQRGRNFGIMLRCLDELGYNVEWRIINAADYGMPQRRRRVYIFAYKNTTNFAKKLAKVTPYEVIKKIGCMAKAFPVQDAGPIDKPTDIRNKYTNLEEVSKNFVCNFKCAGYMENGKIYMATTIPIKKEPLPLEKIVEKNGVCNSCYLTDERIEKFRELRSKKKILRISKSGFQYYYSEGSMSMPDVLSLPGRTMLTSEGGTNRSTHIIADPKTNKLRLLTPIECERLNQFPDDWTNTGMSVSRRRFMMGNALVCGVITELGKTISTIIDEEK